MIKIMRTHLRALLEEVAERLEEAHRAGRALLERGEHRGGLARGVEDLLLVGWWMDVRGVRSVSQFNQSKQGARPVCGCVRSIHPPIHPTGAYLLDGRDERLMGADLEQHVGRGVTSVERLDGLLEEHGGSHVLGPVFMCVHSFL